MDLCHLKEIGAGTSISEIQRQSRTPRWHCKRWLWFVCSVHWTRIISISNDSRKSNGYHIQTARMRRTNSWCGICWYPGKNGRCSKIIENTKIGMSRYLDTSTKAQMAQIMTQLFFSKGTCTVILWQDYYEKGNSRKFHWNTVGKKFQFGNVYSLTEEKYHSYLCVWTISKWPGKKQNINTTWKLLMKDVDLGEPTSFLDHVYFVLHSKRVSHQRWNCGKLQWYCSNPGFLLAPRNNYLAELRWNLMQKQYLLGPSTRKVTQRNVWTDTANLRSKRSITKRTKACDKRLNRLISYIHHTCEYEQYWYVGNTAQHCRFGLFQDSDFAEDLGDSKSTPGGILCIFGSNTFVPRSWMCRNRFQFHTVLQKLKPFLSMQVCAWTVFPLSLSGIWWLKYLIPYRTRMMDPRESHEETRRQLSSQTCITPSQFKHTNVIQTLITFHRIQRILDIVLCCMLLRTMKR